MLIEFSVSNFRSFRERQTLSMVAAPSLGKEGNVFAAPVDGEELPDLLKVAAVYGPNASGKSNLLRALEALSTIARLEPKAGPEPLPVTPFRFDASLIDQPSTFEVHFIENRMRYAFALRASAERIVEERLAAFPKSEEALLYHRKRDEYEFGSNLEGTPVLHQTWSQATNSQVLFLSRAVAHSSVALQQLRHPHLWLTRRMNSLLGSWTEWQRTSRSMMAHMPQSAADVVALLSEADIPVAAIRSNQLGAQRLVFASESENRTTLTHKTALSDAEFDFNEESDGTRNLIGFALPWMLLRENHVDIHSILAIDEFDSSLHPDIVATLVRKHIESEHPKQLIFTTHNTHLMTTKLLRRDQFWLTERDANGATQLRAIHDFEGSEDEDLEKRYFEGRYRAVPLVRRG
jgi:predicted ATPase